MWLVSLFCGCTCFSARCGEGEPVGTTRPPNLLVIVIDTLRADRVGVERDGRSITPNIDALARRGTRFSKMIAQSGWTMPSVTSLVTGRYPSGALLSGPLETVAWIPDDARTVAEVVAMYDYETAVFWGNTVPAWVPEASRGFGHVEGEVPHTEAADSGAPFARWLETAPEQPWLALVHPFDLNVMKPIPPKALHRWADPDHPAPCVEETIHAPLVAKWTEVLGQQAARELMIAHYDGAVAHQDAQVGLMLTALEQRGMAEDTVVILTSDHGQELFEHGSFDHGPPYDFNLRVPLVVYDPREPGGRVVDTMVQTVDLAPTLLELAGATPDAQMVGQSLLPLVRGEAGYEERLAYSVSYAVQLSVRSPSHKLMMCGTPGCEPTKPWDVREPIYELYDLRADPLETTNLVASDPPELDVLKARLAAFVRNHGPGRPTPAARLTREQVKAIQERGYWTHEQAEE